MDSLLDQYRKLSDRELLDILRIKVTSQQPHGHDHHERLYALKVVLAERFAALPGNDRA